MKAARVQRRLTEKHILVMRSLVLRLQRHEAADQDGQQFHLHRPKVFVEDFVAPDLFRVLWTERARHAGELQPRVGAERPGHYTLDRFGVELHPHPRIRRSTVVPSINRM